MPQIAALWATISGDNTKLKAALSDSKSDLKSFGSELATVGKIALAGLGGVTLLTQGARLMGQAIRFSVDAAAESEREQTKLEAVVRSTGGAAGWTSGKLSDMAGELSKLSAVDDEVIQSAQAVLLTFTKVGKDIFPQAMKAALDMSAVMGQDLQSSILQIGKALQDPISGVTALRRVGVMLTDQQEEMIKKMVDANDTIGAQKIVLKELNVEFGAASSANALTYSGSVDQVSNAFGNLGEAIAGGNTLNVMKEFNFQIADGVTLLAEYIAQRNKLNMISPTQTKVLDLVGGKDTLDAMARARREQQQLTYDKQKYADISAGLVGMGLTYNNLLGITAAKTSTLSTVQQTLNSRFDQTRDHFRALTMAEVGLQGAMTKLNVAQEDLKIKQQDWMQDTGGKVVDYLSKDFPWAGKKYEQALMLTDAAMNTTYFATYKQNQAIEDLTKQYAQGKIGADKFESGLEALKSTMPSTTGELQNADAAVVQFRDDIQSILAMDGMTLKATFSASITGGSGPGKTRTGDSYVSTDIPGPGRAHGGSFIIPAGYSEDYPLGGGNRASSGERVTVEPVGKKAGNTQVFYAPVYISTKANIWEVLRELNKQ